MTKARATTFEQAVLASRLLTQEQLQEARAALLQAEQESAEVESPDAAETEDDVAATEANAAETTVSDERLAEQLVKMGLLNDWMASQLIQGRTKFNLGAYRIIDSLGRGGMGQVFKAKHEMLGRIVAIKVLPREKSTPDAVLNFTREIRAQARLDHENLVRAYDAGSDGNVHYLVTEYVSGSDLRRLVRKWRHHHRFLSMEQAASIISQVAAGLQHAHEQGLVHRDVKPANVLVTRDGRAKLSDLGLAGPLAPDVEDDPRLGKIVGTVDYMSPDHIQAPWEPTPAWDIYALGCTLYFAVTGKVPFPHGTRADKIRAHCTLRPVDPRRLNSDLDAAFVEVIADMLAKDPAERIPTAAQVIARLAPWTGSMSSPRSQADARRPQVPPPALPSANKVTWSSDSPLPPQSSRADERRQGVPEFLDLSPGEADASSEASQSTHSIEDFAHDTLPDGGSPKWPSSPMPPRLALLLAAAIPTGLLGVALLVWWLVRLTLGG